jgi:hypothetical protein
MWNRIGRVRSWHFVPHSHVLKERFVSIFYTQHPLFLLDSNNTLSGDASLDVLCCALWVRLCPHCGQGF